MAYVAHPLTELCNEHATRSQVRSDSRLFQMVEILRGSYCPNKSIPRLSGLESPYGLRGHTRLLVGVNGILVLNSLQTWNIDRFSENPGGNVLRAL